MLIVSSALILGASYGLYEYWKLIQDTSYKFNVDFIYFLMFGFGFIFLIFSFLSFRKDKKLLSKKEQNEPTATTTKSIPSSKP